jgi:hypothetical protein
VAQREMARDQPSGRIDLPLAIECAQQSRADFLDRASSQRRLHRRRLAGPDLAQ